MKKDYVFWADENNNCLIFVLTSKKIHRIAKEASSYIYIPRKLWFIIEMAVGSG